MKNKLILTISFFASLLFCKNDSAFAQTAELQVIHNSSDPAANTVDVYVNGTLALNDFTFRSATPFITLPAGLLLNIGVAPGNSMSVNDTIKNFPVTLMAGERYIAVANGVLNPAGFSANPDGAATAFTLFLQDQIRATAIGTDVDFRALHGASDAPTVDVIARNVATLVNDAPYGAITPYITVPPASYILDVTPAAGSPIVASFTADLSTLGGGSAVVFASGFLNPSANQNGPAFGLFAALANGTVVAFPSVSVARLQVIHNAADPAAATVDVYVNGTLALNDFTFRTATPFIDVPADVLLNIGVAPGNSTSVNDTLKNFQVTLVNGGEYLAVANGVLNPTNFAVNPDGTSTAFTLFLQDQMRESATSTDVDFRVVHGASDAPTVDVVVGGNVLVDNAAYSNITPYLSVPPSSYVLNITPGNNNSVVVASFVAPITALGGKSAVILASGFLNPSTNQNGAAFGLLAVLADGTVILLSNVTSVNENNDNSSVSLFPNPAVDQVMLNFKNPLVENVTITIFGIAGQTVNRYSIARGSIQFKIDTSYLSAGIYSINVRGENFSSNQRFVRQ